MVRLAFAYKTVETGIWMDIFPLDSCNSEVPAAEIEPAIQKIIAAWRKYYSAHEKRESVQALTEKKMQFFSSIPSGNKKVWYGYSEIADWKPLVIDDDTVFPLQKAGFEGYDLNVPANCQLYLSKIYDNFMEYPRSGLLHHTDPDGGLAQDRARKHNINMNEVLEYLTSVYSEI